MPLIINILWGGHTHTILVFRPHMVTRCLSIISSYKHPLWCLYCPVDKHPVTIGSGGWDYTHTHTHTHASIHFTHTSTHTRTHTHTLTHMHACMHAHTRTHTHMYTHIYTHTQTHTYTHTHMHTHAHTRTRTHINFSDKSNFKQTGMCWPKCAWFNKLHIYSYDVVRIVNLLNALFIWLYV